MNIKEYKVDIANIKVNPKYQRPLNETWVRKLVKNYDETKVNQLVLSAQPDGTYYVIDGQHTVEATRRAKGEHVLLPAKIFFGLTQGEEADLFYTYNTDRKALSPNDKVRARLARGEAVVVDYFDALDYTGIQYTFGNSKTQLSSHTNCIRVFDSVERNNAIRGMLCYRSAGFKNEPIVLCGIMYFTEKHPEIDDDRLSKKLSEVSPEELRRVSYEIGISTGYSAISISRSNGAKVNTNVRVMARAIALVYNKGMKKNMVDLSTI